jgi:RND family efflux transporter MFP subunit
MQPRSSRRWLGIVGLTLATLAIGAAAGALWTAHRLGAGGGQSAHATAAGASTGHAVHGAAPSTRRADAVAERGEEPLEVSISQEAAQRAGIELVQARREPLGTAITVPGTVASNSYRDTKVNALVGGVVREVHVELGTAVRRDQPLAVVFSNELAEAQMKYLSLGAMLRADDQKLNRTRRLAAMELVSRQELDEVTATQSARASEVAAARQRLYLLGLRREQVEALTDSSQVVSELTLVAPADGLLINRSVNTGQVIAAGQELFVVTDLSTVWIIGDVYEKDFRQVRVGTAAALAVGTPQGRPIHGRVAYIDPRVDPVTRTVKVRVEVPNSSGELRLGMFVHVTLDGADRAIHLVVPRASVQTIGDRSVVYVAMGEERFQERTVSLGAATGEVVEVLSGLKAGERVVSQGSFFVRAEASRARNAG